MRQKFVERRAQGQTYSLIAAELGVAKSTLIEWSRQLRFELQNRCALAMDELRHRLLGPHIHRCQLLVERLARVEEELRQRKLSDLTTAQLHKAAESLRRQLDRETAVPNFIAPVKDIPGGEYVEEVQEWKP